MFVFFLHVYDEFLMYIYITVMFVGMLALKNLSDGVVNVLSSYLVCFEELIFMSMLSPKWLRDKQFTVQ